MDSNGENKSELIGKKGDFLSKLKGLGSLSLDSLTTQQLKKTGPEDKVERPEDKVERPEDKVERPGNEWEIDLSRLELKHQLAQGTYGIVYKGIYNGCDVAVKLLEWGEDKFAHNAKTAALRESFLKEVAVWHKLNHPNVAKFIGASIRINELKIPQKNPTINDRKPLPKRSCCVVVEFVPGGTLKQFLIRHSRKKLAYKTAINLALDLSRGLSYLHSQKIVHRDVKTENMLLDRQGNLKIVDFGVARVEAENPDEMTGETGTLSYMAPEVVEGKPYNRKCDVYSFGICLWEIYCCDMPYCFLTFEALSYAVVRQNLRPDIPKCCPSALTNVMMRCWDPSPDKRPEMDEVVRLLEAINPSKGGGMLPEGKSSKCPCFATPIWGL